MRAPGLPLGRLVRALLVSQLLLGVLLTASAAAEPVVVASDTPPQLALVDQRLETTAVRDQVIALVNHERSLRNLSSLTENATLDAAAQAYTQVLLADTCFGHQCGPEPDFTTRDSNAGYDPWAWLGENVAAGQLTPEAVVEAWMASSIHRENILRPEFTEIGVAIARGGLHGMYWAQEFGARPVD